MQLNVDIVSVICQFIHLEDMPAILLVNKEWSQLSQIQFNHWKPKLYDLLYKQSQSHHSYKRYVQLQRSRRKNWKRMQIDSDYTMQRLRQIQQKLKTIAIKHKIFKLSQKKKTQQRIIVNAKQLMELVEHESIDCFLDVHYLARIVICAIARLSGWHKLSDEETELFMSYFQHLSTNYNAKMTKLWKPFKINRFSHFISRYNTSTDSFFINHLFPHYGHQCPSDTRILLATKVFTNDTTGLFNYLKSNNPDAIGMFVHGVLSFCHPYCLPVLVQFFAKGKSIKTQCNLIEVVEAVHQLTKEYEYVYREIEQSAGELLYSTGMAQVSKFSIVPARSDALYLFCKDLYKPILFTSMFINTQRSIKWLAAYRPCIEYRDVDGLSAMDILSKVQTPSVEVTIAKETLLEYTA
jgi:hypothetical protein